MAGLSKTKTLTLPGNFVTDPSLLPVNQGAAVNAPTIVDAGRGNAGANETDFWTHLGYMGTYVEDVATNSYVTVLNLTNLTRPVIMGNYVGRYPNSSSHHKVKFTVDGREYETPAGYYFNGRLVIGALNNQGVGHDGGYVGSGIRYLAYTQTGASGGTSYSQPYGCIEDPNDMYARGYPLLYAENSLKVEMWSNVQATNQNYKRAGVTWRYLTNV